MNFRPRRLILELLAFLLVGSLLLVGVGVWRLSSGPISLTFLTPLIEDALNPPEADYRIDIGDTQMTWGGWERAIDLVARDVTLLGQEGEGIVTLPKLAVGLSIVDISKGRVRPTSIDLLDANVVLVRRIDGGLAFAINPPAVDKPDGQDQSQRPDIRAPQRTAIDSALIPPEVLAELARPPDGKGLVGALTRLILTNATVWFDNRQTGRTWLAQGINAIITRDDNRLDGTLSGNLILREGTGALSTKVSHIYGSDLFQVSTRVRGAPLAIAGRFDQGLAAWLPPEKLIDLDLSLDLDGEARPRAARLGVVTEFAAFTLAADRLIQQSPPADAPEAPTETAPTKATDSLVEGTLTIDRLEPARLAGVIAPLGPLGVLDAPVTGEGRFRLDGDGGLRSLDIALNAGSGVAVLPDIYPDGLVFFGADLDVGIQVSEDGTWQAGVRDMTIDLGGPRLMVTAQALLSAADGLTGRFDAILSDMSMQRLDGLWPPTLAKDARDWVVPNIPRADVDQARIGVTFSAAGVRDVDGLARALEAEEPPLSIDTLGGEIEFRNAFVDYLAPLQPAKGVDGRATYDLEHLAVDVTSGTVGDILLEKGRVEITGFADATEAIAIDLDLDAPLPSALALLDTEPFGFVKQLGLDSGAMFGHARAKASFSFPLIHDLKGSDVMFEAAARLAKVTVPEPSLDIVATAPTLELWIDNQGLDVSGPISIDGLRTILTWRESFDEAQEVARHMTIESRPMAADLGRFGIEIVEFIDGEIESRLDYKALRGGDHRLSLSADLTRTAIDLQALNWAKPLDQPASLEVEATIPAAGPLQIPYVAFSAEGEEGGMAAEASLSVARDFSAIDRLDLRRLSYGPHFMTGTMERTANGRYGVLLEGSSVDISGIVGGDEEGQEIPPHAEMAEEKPGPAFDLQASFDQVIDAQSRRMENVRIDLKHDGRDVEVLFLDADMPEGGKMSVDYAPDAAGAQQLRVAADDAGAVLSTLDWTTRLQGGRLVIEGMRPDPDAPLAGHVTVEEFTLLRAPGITKVLEFMTLTGIRSALTQGGLPFDRLEADFSYLNDILKISDARAFGAAIGFTTQGEVDFATDYIKLEGTAAPMYSISRVIGAIPILGDILTAGGEGLFAANYALEGPLDDPDVSVNPLSVLAPGFLRRLFDAPSPTGEDVPIRTNRNEERGN